MRFIVSNIQLMLVCHVVACRSHFNEDKGQKKEAFKWDYNNANI